MTAKYPHPSRAVYGDDGRIAYYDGPFFDEDEEIEFYKTVAYAPGATIPRGAPAAAPPAQPGQPPGAAPQPPPEEK